MKTRAVEQYYLGVEIKPGYSIFQFLAIILVPFFANALISDLLSSTTDVMKNKDYYNISDDDLPKKVSELNFFT